MHSERRRGLERPLRDQSRRKHLRLLLGRALPHLLVAIPEQSSDHIIWARRLRCVPKGTTFFLAPRQMLLEAYDGITSYYADPRNVNDDTALIRFIAARSRIWISPQFSCRYESRDSLRRFLPHLYHRGIVLVDGHLRTGARLAPFIAAFYPLSLAGVAVTSRWPSAPLIALGALSAGAAAAGAVRHLSPAHVAALAVVTPLSAIPYGVGVWAGGALALRAGVARLAQARRAARS